MSSIITENENNTEKEQYIEKEQIALEDTP